MTLHFAMTIHLPISARYLAFASRCFIVIKRKSKRTQLQIPITEIAVPVLHEKCGKDIARLFLRGNRSLHELLRKHRAFQFLKLRIERIECIKRARHGMRSEVWVGIGFAVRLP
ncbi:hypothetical protein [Paraburkholderia tropica]|uniref:hypothetical protein n=1 Tax=Paraburkholderia tropica TaxID=92647 RepID=UPI001CC753C6|nr:hypothetical protein [Paraburkholderia tropica]